MLKMFACLWICIVLCISLSRGQSCLSGLLTGVQNCYKAQGLNFNSQGNETVETILKKNTDLDPSVQCADINKYKSVSSCSMTLIKSCLMTSGQSGLIPDIQLMNQGIDYFCNNLNNMDLVCFKERIPSVTQCGQTVGYEVGRSYPEVSRMTATEILCLSYDIVYDCISVHMSSCPKSTAQIYLNLMDKYILPSACLNKNPSRANRQSYTYLASDGRGHHSDHHYLILLFGVFFLFSLI